MSTFSEVCTEFYKAFTRENPRNVWSLKEGSPEWMRDAIREAHWDSRLPDDWIYESCRGLLSDMSDRDSVDGDDMHEICDGHVDIYTSVLTAWLASHTYNLALCDEAVKEGLASEDSDMETRIKSAQYMALTYIFGALQSAIESEVESRDESMAEADAECVPS